MRQILFRIPLDGPWSLGPLGEVPGFGFGVVLLAWVLLGAWWLYRYGGELRLGSELITPIVVWAGIAVSVVMLPRWVQSGSTRAIAETTAALEHPSFTSHSPADLHLRRAGAWHKKREYARARDDYRAALRVDPDSREARRSLAWLLATCPDEDVRDGREAIRIAEELDSRTHEDYDTLAAAYAEAGRFDDAVSATGQAAAMAANSRDPRISGLVSDLRKRLALYDNGIAYRDTTAGVSVPIYGYGFLMFLGFLGAAWTAARRARTAGVEPGIMWDLMMWVVFAGIGGARLFYLLQYHQKVFADRQGLGDHLRAIVDLREGGLVLYGGVVCALAAFFVFCRVKGQKPLLLADIVVPSFFVGLAFGRLGCFMNGCCYGDRCDLPWAVTFPLGSVPDIAMVGRGFVEAAETFTLALHPSQIYSSLNALVLAFLTHAYFKYRTRDGAVLALGLLAYPVTRFLIEYLRGDEMGQLGTSLTIAQWASIGLFAAGVAYTAWLSRSRKPAGTAGLRASVARAPERV